MKLSLWAAAATCAATFGAGSFAVAEAPATGTVLVVTSHDAPLVREGAGYIAMYDPVSGAKRGQIDIDRITPHELIVLKDGKRALAPVFGSGGVGTPGTDGDSIAVIDLVARKVTGYIELGRKNRPHFGVLGEKDGLVYITTELDDTVTVIDPQALKVTAILPTGQPQSHNVAVSRDGKRAYTSNVYVGTVSVINIPKRKLEMVVPVAVGGKDPSGGPVNWAVQRIVVSNDDRLVMTCDWKTSELVAIDTRSLEIVHRVKIPAPCYGMAATHDGRFMLTADYGADSVSVIDMKSMKLLRSIPTPKKPQEIVISPAGDMAFVTCVGTDEIARIDMKNWTVDKVIAGGRWPDGIAWSPL
ncbi:MAG: hypothetical protein QM696_04100 [Steroidobacteraceae bacterium]